MTRATTASTTVASQQAARSVVVCQGVSKHFKDFWMRDRAKAVDNLTFDIRPREVFGLLGPNGSGKSTTIKMILGLLRPTRGRVAVFGQPPTDVEIKKRIGYLPEESYLYPFLNARETLDYYGRLFQIDAKVREKRIEELIDMVGLRAAQFRQVREYSKGMQRRIGLAQALINDPDLLILDEPTTGLDPIGTKQVKDLIVELGRRGKTVLLSSHLLADVEDVVHRMVILYGGKKRAEGTCDELLEARTRTSIEFDALDEDTVSEIDTLVRRRSAGEKAVIRVTKPRQRLEDLFLDIVERARSERLETSGAESGRTAAFLVGADAATQGENLIDRLVQGEEQPPQAPEPVAPVAKGPSESESDRVIDALISGRSDEPAPAPPAPPAAHRPREAIRTDEIDLGMIDGLTDEDRKP